MPRIPSVYEVAADPGAYTADERKMASVRALEAAKQSRISAKYARCGAATEQDEENACSMERAAAKIDSWRAPPAKEPKP